jgi:hypothetical protein
MAGLEIQIGGDTTDWNLKVKEVERDIKELSKEKQIQIKAGLDTTEITKNIKDAKKSLADLKTTLKDTGNTFSKDLAPKVANGSNALTQFSRIAQDAPFGIIGIGNNITATAEAFSALKNQTGSTGGALKAVASSMLGSGGILLAVSLVTTGLTYMAQNGLTVEGVFRKLTGTFNENAEAIKKASIEGAKSASEEIINLKALTSVAQNEALSRKDRLIAVEKLQQAYPAYFGNLSKEQILTGNITSAVNELTKALISKAIAEKLASDSAEIQLKIFEANAKLNAAKARTTALEIKLSKDLAAAQKSVGNSAAQLAIIRAKGLNAINDSKDAEQEARDEILKGTEALKQRQDIINKLTAASIKLSATQPKAGKTKKTFSTPQVSGTDSSLNVAGLVDVNQIAVVTGELDKFGGKVKELPGVIKTSMGTVRETVSSELIAIQTILFEFNKEANSIILGSITSTFSNLGTAIGDALANGKNVFSAIGNSLLASLGSFLSDMGDLLIKYGALAVVKGKLDAAILAGGPVSIAAGVAAIAVGVALKAAGGAVGAKASGKGSSSGGGSISTGADYSSPSQSSGGGSSSFGGGTVVFEIAGTSLIGVLNNTLDKNKRLGGNLPIG